MKQQMEGKLNWLHHNLPEGLVVDAAWLERHGYRGDRRSRYTKAGWLNQVARGVYRRPPANLQGREEDGQLRWQNVVISLQTLLEWPGAVGGRTALELQGFAHYLPVHGPQDIHLYADKPLPNWMGKLTLDVRFVFHNAKKLFRNDPIVRGLSALSVDLKTNEQRNTDPIHSGLTVYPWGDSKWPLTLSTPERAILELIDALPQNETFHQVDVLMEGLRTLSPRRLNKLLIDCRSVKVKRLFFWFAERHNFTWLEKLERANIDLGRGHRMIVRGGKLDPTYKITVPDKLDAGG